jgi:hypothetical protein
LAYHLGLIIAKAAISYLPENSWKSHQSLTYDIYLSCALNSYNCKNYEEAEKLFDECIANAKYEFPSFLRNIFNRSQIFLKIIFRDIFQKITVYEQRTSFLLEKLKYADCLNSGFECVKLLGLELPTHPSDEQVYEGNIKISNI